MRIISPCKISSKNIISAPASKSMMQRAIAIATLAKGRSVLHGYTSSNDSDAALNIAQDLGARLTKQNSTIIIEGGFNPKTASLNCGEAGLGIRMFTPIASISEKPITLHGEGSLKTRPISTLIQPLQDLGVTIDTNNGFVPVTVKGPIIGNIAHVDGSLSSQILTGLLLAAPFAKNKTILKVHDLKSKPYIDMTLQIMNDFGVNAHNIDYKEFIIENNQEYKALEYFVEGDWSGASFLVVAGALGGSVKIDNVRPDSKQADIAILKAVFDAGAIVRIEKNAIEIEKHSLQAFEFDATECPDLFPPLVALAAHCNGITKIKGVSRLKHKESDRATVLKNEFFKIGTQIDLDGDYMYVNGGTVTQGRIHANNDHRIAMAAACVAILAKGPIVIENPECIAKSYPNFFEEFEKISDTNV